MISARPEVKRTYSRLNKEITQIQDPKNVKDNDSPKGFDMKTQELTSLAVTSEFEVAKVDKMRKITDFFRVKRGDEIIESSSPIRSHNTQCTSSSPVTSVTNKMKKQTFLDLGQRDLVSSQCRECLMHFNKSFPDDVALHKKFHAQYLKGYNFNVKVDGVACKEIAPEAGDKMITWSKYRFYEILTFESGALIKKLEFFLNFVHVQLGAEPLTPAELKEHGRYTAIFAVDHESTRIVGFVLFEKCKKVYRSRLDCDDSAIELEQGSGAVEGVNIGVSRIWVDSKHRSRGLASMLLDLKTLERSDFAFSQPTPAGFAFAKKFQSGCLQGRQCYIYLQ